LRSQGRTVKVIGRKDNGGHREEGQLRLHGGGTVEVTGKRDS
jgi:hypothetical protein